MDPLACNTDTGKEEGRKRTLLSKRMGREPRPALVEKRKQGTWPSKYIRRETLLSKSKGKEPRPALVEKNKQGNLAQHCFRGR